MAFTIIRWYCVDMTSWCPVCSMEVTLVNGRCPDCDYEFTETKKNIQEEEEEKNYEFDYSNKEEYDKHFLRTLPQDKQVIWLTGHLKNIYG